MDLKRVVHLHAMVRLLVLGTLTSSYITAFISSSLEYLGLCFVFALVGTGYLKSVQKTEQSPFLHTYCISHQIEA